MATADENHARSDRKPRARLSGSVEERPVPIEQTDRDDVLGTIREVFGAGGPRSRDQAIHDLADALGYGRAGSKIGAVLRDDMRTAVRRGILDNQGGRFTLLCQTIDEYARDHLVEMLLAAMGPNWQTRDEAITAAARHLGFRRTGSNIRAAFKSAINASIRRSLIERDGADHIRRQSRSHLR